MNMGFIKKHSKRPDIGFETHTFLKIAEYIFIEIVLHLHLPKVICNQSQAQSGRGSKNF